jgi:hypothetical protein
MKKSILCYFLINKKKKINSIWDTLFCIPMLLEQCTRKPLWLLPGFVWYCQKNTCTVNKIIIENSDTELPHPLMGTVARDFRLLIFFYQSTPPRALSAVEWRGRQNRELIAKCVPYILRFVELWPCHVPGNGFQVATCGRMTQPLPSSATDPTTLR